MISDVAQQVPQCGRNQIVDIGALLDGDPAAVQGMSLPSANHSQSADPLALAARASDAALVLITDTPAAARWLRPCATTALWIDRAAAEFADWDDAAVVVTCDVRCTPDDTCLPFATWLLA